MVGPQVAAGQPLWLRLTAEPVTVTDPPPDFTPYWPSMLRSTHARINFAYSLDGVTFQPLGGTFVSRQGRWVGTQLAIFAQAPSDTPAFTATSVGYAEFDWFRFSP